MKVGCQQCGASYSVADDKVAGRRLKLRCKKCGEPMVIDGSGNDPSVSVPFGAAIQIVQARPSTVPALAASTEPDWYLAVDDNAQGPYTLQDVVDQFVSGRIAHDTLVFHDGLEGWKEARDVAELQDALEAAGVPSDQRITPAVAPPAPRARTSTPVAALLEQSVPMGNDPFAEPPSAPPSFASSPRVAASEMMAAGPQRDGTVTFSLDAIRALSATTPNLVSSPPTRPGYASGEGSGSIDMRALTAEAPEAGAFRALAELQGSPLDTMAPLALPVVQHAVGVDFRTKVYAGLASFGFLLAGAVGIFAVTRNPPAAQPVAAAASAPQAAGALASPQASAAMAAEPQPAMVKEAAPVEAQPVAAEGEAAADGERSVAREPRGGARRRGATHAESKRDASKPRESKPAKGSSDIDDMLAGKAPEKKAPAAAKGGSSDIDDLLLGAINGKKAPEKREAAPAADSALPKTPSRDQMLAALGKAKNKAAKCKGTGVATAAITIAGPTGKVANISVSGVDGAAKSCVEKAVRSTAFPKFQKDTFAVNFPFKLGA